MTSERELSPDETHLAFRPMRELRPHLEQIHLDSAPPRHAAHRLYLNERFQISSFHFSREV